MKRRILFALLMAFVTCGLVLIVVLMTNEGYTQEFWRHWWKAFKVGYIVVLLSILFIAPLIQKFVERIISEKQG